MNRDCISSFSSLWLKHFFSLFFLFLPLLRLSKISSSFIVLNWASPPWTHFLWNYTPLIFPPQWSLFSGISTVPFLPLTSHYVTVTLQTICAMANLHVYPWPLPEPKNNISNCLQGCLTGRFQSKYVKNGAFQLTSALLSFLFSVNSPPTPPFSQKKKKPSNFSWFFYFPHSYNQPISKCSTTDIYRKSTLSPPSPPLLTPLSTPKALMWISGRSSFNMMNYVD